MLLRETPNAKYLIFVSYLSLSLSLSYRSLVLYEQPRNLAIIRLDRAVDRDLLRSNALILYSRICFRAHAHTHTRAYRWRHVRRFDYVQNYLQWYTD